ncbi:Indole-3-glycerol phosphate synthase [Porphyridium purpureum]|uniref:indole-3-glycerol-phosphate synthase n=1 Tax=Porphyridium purpureum TaxID=35688 RepID=A0A5J4Z781_PORPP|nr:Indole-3-glycerol phosphate synthase [Porphyridium purpureum]|eukprot:POR8050..scf295_1
MSTEQGPSWRPAGILRDIVKEKEMAMALYENTLSTRPDHPLNLRLAFAAPAGSARLARAMRDAADAGHLCVVAEIKGFQNLGNIPRPRERLSVGELEGLVDASYETPQMLATELAAGGVDAFLVASDAARYGGSLDAVKLVSKQLRKSGTERGPPVIRHDFIIHPIQIAEAAENGATAVNIVAGACLIDLEELLTSATMMGIEAVVECHTEIERDLALEAGAAIIMLSNYDRSIGQLVRGRAEQLVSEIPEFVQTLAYGGITTATDAWRYMDMGFDGVVIGTSLLKSRRRTDFVRELKSEKRVARSSMFGNFGYDNSRMSSKAFDVARSEMEASAAVNDDQILKEIENELMSITDEHERRTVEAWLADYRRSAANPQ